MDDRAPCVCFLPEALGSIAELDILERRRFSRLTLT